MGTIIVPHGFRGDRETIEADILQELERKIGPGARLERISHNGTPISLVVYAPGDGICEHPLGGMAQAHWYQRDNLLVGIGTSDEMALACIDREKVVRLNIMVRFESMPIPRYYFVNRTTGRPTSPNDIKMLWAFAQ